MCGMTTAFAWMVRGAVFKALHAQPAGVFLFLGTVLSFAIATLELVRPRQRWLHLWRKVVVVEGWVLLVFFSVLGLGWAYKVWVMWGSIY